MCHAACHASPPLLQLLATAEDERARHAEEAALLSRAQEAQAALREAAEVRAAEELRLRLDVAHRNEELEEAAAEAAGVAAALGAQLAQLQGDLQRAQAEGLALAQDKARLEVRGGGSRGRRLLGVGSWCSVRPAACC